MDVKIGTRWEGVIAEAVASGRYASPEDVVAEGLRRVAEDEEKFAWLKAKLEDAIARGGETTLEDFDAAMDAVDAELKAEGL